MNEAISVEARFSAEGTITPLNFIWRGDSYRITSLGRRWEKSGGLHFLVMDSLGEVYEIAFDLERQRWRLCKAPRKLRAGGSQV